MESETIDQETRVGEKESVLIPSGKSGTIQSTDSKGGEKLSLWQTTSNLLGSTFNLVNTIVGAGILSFPYAFLCTGLVSGLIIVFVVLIVCVVSLRILFMAIHEKTTKEGKKFNCYEDLMEEYFGSWWKKINELSMFLCLTCVMSYLTIIGDSITSVLHYFVGDEAFYCKREFIITVFACAIIFPLCCFRSLSSLKYTSFLSICSIVYVMGLVPITAIIEIAEKGSLGPGVSERMWINFDTFHGIVPKIFMALPIFGFAFSCHPVTQAVYNGVKKPSILKLDIITLLTYAIVLIGYILVGVFGFLLFGDVTESDVLVNFDGDSVWAIIGRSTITIVSTFSYPLITFVQRSTVFSVFYQKKKIPDVSYFLLTFFLFMGNLVGALLIPDISTIISFSSSTGVCMITFFFPAMFACKLIYNRYKSCLKRALCLILPILLFIFSIFFIIVGNLSAVFSLIPAADEE